MKIINNFPKITKLDNIENELIDKAPIDHASTDTTYGASTSVNYGHVKLSDSYTSSAGAASASIGASSKAVADAYKDVNDRLTTLSNRGIGSIYTVSQMMSGRQSITLQTRFTSFGNASVYSRQSIRMWGDANSIFINLIIEVRDGNTSDGVRTIVRGEGQDYVTATCNKSNGTITVTFKGVTPYDMIVFESPYPLSYVSVS